MRFGFCHVWSTIGSSARTRFFLRRALSTDTTAQIVISGHAFTQNLRRGHYELTADIRPTRRVAAAFTALAHAI